ncbi:Gfo/Idh/MocA family protein [Paenibacillus sp. BC26]|uniref:Gfo/Idh/MocA family protein n=1 Tax=Paenibacillus sp. BC26 TaxID=1881032 RepID=UPI0008F0442C|nr:Gfo/Idh/MocA family oxidoreductase [Paenibacillus sp. BC26]SFS74259.1 Predicted dehydrogenase [Paenibacillus sp. BC26]
MGKINSSTVRVAVIGAGWMANSVHYPSLASLADVEIAGICDLNTDALTRTANKYEIANRYTDYKKMIAEVQPDAVYAIGQPHIMYDIWMWVLEQGINLYIEKPLGITIHQAMSLAYTAEKNKCITQVSLQRRSSTMVSQLRDECLKRGPITHAGCKFYKSDITPFLSARDRMMDDTVHSIDTVRWMCGGNVVAIESETKRIGVPDINFISATLHFDNGSSGYLINSWSSGRRIFAVEMHAPNICVEAEHETRGFLYADGDTKGIEYDAKKVSGSDELFIYGGFQNKHREFIDSLKSGALPQSHFGDAIKTMEVAEKILAQSLLRV